MSSGSLWAQTRDAVGEMNVAEMEPGVVCYTGSHYVVRIDDRFSDQQISVVRQNNRRDNKCSTPISRRVIPLNTIDDPRYLIDLKGPYLLMDSGCCPGFRGIGIYNLENNEQLYEGLYWSDEPVSWTDSMSVSFWKGVKGNREDCPKADEYEGYGGNYGFEERVVFDLEKKTLSGTGEIKCSYRM